MPCPLHKIVASTSMLDGVVGRGNSTRVVQRAAECGGKGEGGYNAM